MEKIIFFQIFGSTCGVEIAQIVCLFTTNSSCTPWLYLKLVINLTSNFRFNFEIPLWSLWTEYIARCFIRSRLIESTSHCYQILSVQLYLHSTQTPLANIITYITAPSVSCRVSLKSTHYLIIVGFLFVEGRPGRERGVQKNFSQCLPFWLATALAKSVQL